MNYKNYASDCLKAAQLKFDEAEVYLEVGEDVSVTYRDGKQDSLGISGEVGMELKVRRGKRWANAYTEQVDEHCAEDLIGRIEQILAIAEENENQSLYEGSLEDGYEALEMAEGISYDPVRTVTQMEAATEEARKIAGQSLKTVVVEESFAKRYRLIQNTHGLEREENGSYGIFYLSIILERGGVMKSHYVFHKFDKDASLNIAELVKEAYEGAASAFDGRSVTSAAYKVILDPNCVANLMRFVAYSISAENEQKGLSLFRDKVGERVASDKLTLMDDPRNAKGFLPRGFDGEGVPATVKTNIDKGVLKQLYYNLETARKAAVETSGNASRSYKSPSSPEALQLFVQPGSRSPEDIIAEQEEALLLTELQGLHSGMNPISGDFSLPASGYLIKNGKKERAVNQITVAGNLLDLLQDIEEVCNDQMLTLSGSLCPSILLRELAVSGSEED